jgi:predicted SAM-dependent methyltransferase
MMPRMAKAAFYVAAGPLMKATGGIYRELFAPRRGVVKVHLGPGKEKYLNGWINVDANMFTGKCDVWADLRNKLPFRDGSVDAFYSHHVVEHLPDLQFHFDEMYRCLKVGGVFRVGGPNGDVAIRKFLDGDAAWFGDYPDKRTSIGGRFENFIFCRQEHLTILTHSYLKEVAANAGFSQLQLRRPVSETGFPDSFGADVLGTESETTPECAHTIIVEAQKGKE